MSLLEKLENAINNLLTLLGSVLVRALGKITPAAVKNAWQKFISLMNGLILTLKNLPGVAMKKGPVLLNGLKTSLLGYDYKEKLKTTYQAALTQYTDNKPGKKLSSFKKVVLTPVLLMGQWLKGLTTSQSLLLLGFTAASFLAAINILFSGHRLLNQQKESRSPASVEEEVLYERPDYYKKQHRHLEMTNIRLPVYFANVNELRTIDVDFTATLSNRMSRMQLEKLEFQLRDHLILTVEPMLANFPLEEEGKVILRDKIWQELNDFMLAREIEGQVQDLKLTYILAN